MSLILKYGLPVYQLLFPNQCESCGRELVANENIACVACLSTLGKTRYHLMPNNPFEKKFWGRVEVGHGTAMYYFNKGNAIQCLLHALKYKSKIEIGWMLGKLFAREIEGLSWIQDIHLVIPVPLSQAKLRSRGYNQSEIIASSFSKHLALNMDVTSLVRRKNTETQTKKTRSERIENVKNAFEVVNAASLKNRHILLVDDVITTGATLESCAETILAVPGCKVSMVTVAYASE